MYKNTVRLFLQANAYNQLSPFIFLFCDKGVSMHVARALFSLTKGLNYSIMVKKEPKLQFNFYDIKTDTCVFHFTEIF